MQFVEIDQDKTVSNPGYAPYLDYRPITDDERSPVSPLLEASWLNEGLESQIIDYAVTSLIPEHLKEVKAHKEALVPKTIEAVKDRLTKENQLLGQTSKRLEITRGSRKANGKNQLCGGTSTR